MAKFSGRGRGVECRFRPLNLQAFIKRFTTQLNCRSTVSGVTPHVPLRQLPSLHCIHVWHVTTCVLLFSSTCFLVICSVTSHWLYMQCTSNSRALSVTLPPTAETRHINGSAAQGVNRGRRWGLRRDTSFNDFNQTVSELAFYGIHAQGQGGSGEAAAWARYESGPNMGDGLGSLEIHNYALWYVKICNSSECSVWSYSSLLAERTRLSHPLYGRHGATGDLVTEFDLRMYPNNSTTWLIASSLIITINIKLVHVHMDGFEPLLPTPKRRFLHGR